MAMFISLQANAQDVRRLSSNGLSYAVTTVDYSSDVAMGISYYPTIFAKEKFPLLSITIVDPSLSALYQRSIKKMVIRIDEAKIMTDSLGVRTALILSPEGRAYKDILTIYEWHDSNVLKAHFYYWACEVMIDRTTFYSVPLEKPSKVSKKIDELLCDHQYGTIDIYIDEYSHDPDYSIPLKPQVFEAIKKLYKAFK